MEFSPTDSPDNNTHTCPPSSTLCLTRGLHEDFPQAHVSSSTGSVVVGFLCSIIIMSVLGNSLIIYIVASDRRLHRAPFYFLTSLSALQLSKAVFCVPFSPAVVVNGFSWIYGKSSCILLAFAYHFFTFGSTSIMLTMAIDRYTCITFPRTYKKCSRTMINVALITFCLGIALCLSFPPVFDVGKYQFIEAELQCTFLHKPYEENTTLGFTVVFIFLLITSTFVYVRIFVFLRGHRRMCPLYHEPARSDNWTFFGPGANGQALINLLNGFTGGPLNPIAAAVQNMPQTYGRVVNLRVLRNEHLTRLFFIANTVYIVLWLPYLFQVFCKVFGFTDFISTSFILVSAVLSHATLALGPVVYVLYGSPLRTSVVRKLKEWRQRQFYAAVQRQASHQQEGNITCINLPL